jgi:hypothetical protein
MVSHVGGSRVQGWTLAMLANYMVPRKDIPAGARGPPDRGDYVIAYALPK